MLCFRPYTGLISAEIQIKDFNYNLLDVFALAHVGPWAWDSAVVKALRY